MKITYQEKIQGYLLTSVKFDFSIYEKRILRQLVEAARADTKSIEFNKPHTVERSTLGNRVFKISLSDFKKHKDDNNYAQIRKALLSLSNKIIEYETDDEWKRMAIIEKPKIDKYSSFTTFEVQVEIWDAVLELGKNYSNQKIDNVLSLKSIYSIRFLKLFENNQEPVTFYIDDLKKRFDIEDRYISRPADFIKNVVEIAKRELDKKSEQSFSYEALKEGRKITKIRFIPKSLTTDTIYKMDDNKVQKEVPHRFGTSDDLLKFLNGLGFTKNGIRNNLELFQDLSELQDIHLFLKKIFKKAANAHNPQGYMIAAMRRAVSKGKTETGYNALEKAHVSGLIQQLVWNKK